MKLLLVVISLVYTIQISAECVHDGKLSGLEILNLKDNQNIYVQTGDKFTHHLKVPKINPAQTYDVQRLHYNVDQKQESLGNRDRYNRKYVQYYEYEHMVKFITDNQALWNNKDYHSEVIGKSLGGRNLYAIIPNQIDYKKKTIIMFGRHHGDEGTANWIIEGFLKKFFTANHDYQLIVYPMINPDGAEDQVRYNRNGRDLNRVWHTDMNKNYDEVKIVHTHLHQMQKNLEKVLITLDMHGSFTEDFIFRVNKRFKGIDFYNHQEEFIQQLGVYDSYQGGDFQLSDGHPRMARIVMVKDYGINALTHESIRNVRKGRGRDIQTLKQQGVDVFQTLSDLY